jgi:threonine synthase
MLALYLLRFRPLERNGNCIKFALSQQPERRMRYYSTNHISPVVSFEDAVFKGLPEDNGLYMPAQIPGVPPGFFSPGSGRSLHEIARIMLSPYAEGEIDMAALDAIIEDAFNFDVPLVPLYNGMYVAELFHGPTLAFKDFGARFMARVMGHFNRDNARDIHILVATSGDTGSAVAQGFYSVDGVHVTLLYPVGKVSAIQERQLTTVGGNVTALEVDGTFDDCQRMVKEAFLDGELNKSMMLSSANSINIARLLPQSLYYAFAYCSLPADVRRVMVSVPSGNFGNLCGGLIAKRMGLPIDTFVAATNINHVVPDYLQTGIFLPRPSIGTISNAMDVGNPSNFARILDLYGGDYAGITGDVEGHFLADDATKRIIQRVYEQHGYIMCPHTAVGFGALERAMANSAGFTGISLSTAHPAKFGDIVDPLISEPVRMPERLKRIVEREKKALDMGASFDDLKSYLMDHK